MPPQSYRIKPYPVAERPQQRGLLRVLQPGLGRRRGRLAQQGLLLAPEHLLQLGPPPVRWVRRAPLAARGWLRQRVGP